MSTVGYLDQEQNALVIKAFRGIVETCIGPRGWLKAFKTADAGFAMLTTTSTKIFNSLTVHKPILQVLLAGLKSHSQVHSDGGLFLANLASSMYLAHIESKVPRHLCITINDYVCKKAIEILQKTNLSFKLDVGKLADMMIPLKSILSSKPACQLSVHEVNHLCVLIVKAFYNSLSANSSDVGITIVACEGPSVMESHLARGILLPAPHTDCHEKKILSSLNGRVKVVVCTLSLAGHQNVVSGKAVTDERGKTSINNFISDEIFKFCDNVIKADVKLVLCQRVVHPSVKQYLKRNGTFVCERLGFQPIKTLCTKLKAVPIQSLLVDICNDNFGDVGNIELMEFNSNRYLAIRSMLDNSDTYTIMLCASQENALDELKCTVQAAERLLFQLIRDPRVLAGAGCFEVQMAALIRKMATYDAPLTAINFGNATEAQLGISFESIAKSFEHIAKAIQRDMGDYYTDTTFCHFWCFPSNKPTDTFAGQNYTCCCGAISCQSGLQFRHVSSRGVNKAQSTNPDFKAVYPRDLPDVADSFITKRESITTAFELCNVMLRVGITLQ